MDNIQQWWTQLQELFSSTNLQWFLAVGSGILAVALLVLALTKWGHSRPVWKCVILSFAAHLLLIGYAYGTRLIFDTPVVAEQPADPLRVNLIEEDAESTEGEDELDSSQQNTWDQFVNQPEMPSIDLLVRPEIDSEVVVEKTADRNVEKPSPSDNNIDLNQLPSTVVDPELADSPNTSNNDLPIEAPELEPQPIDVVRRGQATDPAPNPPAFQDSAQMPRQELAPNVAPLAKTNSGQDTTQAPELEPPFTSDLVDVKSPVPFAPESLPPPAAAPEFQDIRPLSSLGVKNQMRRVSRPHRIGDGQPLPKIYSLRNSVNRLEVARRRGGSIETERAVELALQWLANNQEEDGRWDPQKTGAGHETKVFGHNRQGAGAQADTGITALATLAFLASGQSHLEGQYKDEVRKALEYLARQQKSNGDLSGDARLFARMYCHSMSLLAISEALAMTGDQRLLDVTQRGVLYSVSAQNRQDGGWRYQPGDAGDMSQFGWQVLALHSAKLGGAVVPKATFSRMEKFLDACTSGAGKGLASYRPNQGPSTTMTAEALLCRYFLNQNVSNLTQMEASRQISRERPTPNHVNLYYWYYGTLAMYHAGGHEWDRWNEELKRTLLKLQHQTGSDAGSWPANGVWGGYGGRVYSTSMAALNLEVYYRYLPIYQELASEPGVSTKR